MCHNYEGYSASAWNEKPFYTIYSVNHLSALLLDSELTKTNHQTKRDDPSMIISFPLNLMENFQVGVLVSDVYTLIVREIVGSLRGYILFDFLMNFLICDIRALSIL